ncbi:hypothetical protein ERJ75_000448100 [Trypanosoma vivax]|nr:hypothetical protein TRVL_07648 [Trypanosoma vivax]KAH8608442.1 hypothetical protein ERJ75_001310900 [Trypanosoma vivax]KAH8616746.1 hypothetical protein ERJ75_000448100 [Trypanosoma vivax]
MKVGFAAVALLALFFASPVYGGSPLQYDNEVHEMCQFYSGLALLQNEADVKKDLLKSKCDARCINEIATAAKWLVNAFKGSYWRWKECGEHYNDGCCLGDKNNKQRNGKRTPSLWVGCFFPEVGSGAKYENGVSDFLNKFILNDAKINKWLKGVTLTLERDSKRCRYTTSDFSGWSAESETFGGLFDVIYYKYPESATLKLIWTQHDSGSFHTLLCMLRCAGYVSKLTVGHCDDKCGGDNVQVPEGRNVEPESHENVASDQEHREPQDGQANGSAGLADGRRGTNEEDEKHTSNATQASVASDVYRSLTSSKNLTFEGSSNEIGAVKRGGNLKETAETYTPSPVSGLQGTSATTSVALLIASFLLELFPMTALIE